MLRLARPTAPVYRFAIRSMSSAISASYESLKVSSPAPGVSLIELHRPKALNALNRQLISELGEALKRDGADDSIKAIVLTGSERAFAAGADIKEMADLDFASAYESDFISAWSAVSDCRKPLIAAVNGYALGGGCEVAMMCDILYAGDKAVFGQPEITIGTIPGAGGTQRLIRAIGKARSMELILTGKNFSAQEAYEWGLAARVFPAAELVAEAVKTASVIASKSTLAVAAAKSAVNNAYETTLAAGLRHEKSLFYGLFSSEERHKLMTEFTKRGKK